MLQIQIKQEKISGMAVERWCTTRLHELEFYSNVADLLLRIKWIGIGVIAQTPIHAATGYKKTNISKWQPFGIASHHTLPLLDHCNIPGPDKLHLLHLEEIWLIATMPKISGKSSLNVIREANSIRQYGGNLRVEIFNKPTARRLLGIFPNCNLTHFACHGVSSIDPLYLTASARTSHPTVLLAIPRKPLRMK